MSVTAKCLAQAAYVSSSGASIYAPAASTKAIIDKLTVTNVSGSDRTLSIYLVPSGGSAGDSNLIVKTATVTAGATSDFSQIQNQILNSGDQLYLLSSASSALVARASGREIT